MEYCDLEDQNLFDGNYGTVYVDQMGTPVVCPNIEMSCVEKSLYDQNYAEEFKNRFGIEDEYFGNPTYVGRIRKRFM